MSEPVFSITDSSTWPVVLTAAHLAAIYQRSVGGVKKACQLNRFIPAPFEKQPFRWRRVDVLRHVEGARGFGMRKVG